MNSLSLLSVPLLPGGRSLLLPELGLGPDVRAHRTGGFGMFVALRLLRLGGPGGASLPWHRKLRPWTQKLRRYHIKTQGTSSPGFCPWLTVSANPFSAWRLPGGTMTLEAVVEGRSVAIGACAPAPPAACPDATRTTRHAIGMCLTVNPDRTPRSLDRFR